MSDVAIDVVADPERACAERLAAQARAGGSIVLTGGSTPRDAYEIAAELEPDWSRAEVWWGDERCVPPDDERSNYGMAKAALLDRLAVPPAAVHRMRGELGRDDGAADYERELGGRVTFDLLLLGLGPDGHMASLFPGSPQLGVLDRRVTSGPAGLEPFVDRITLTLPALQAARRIVFLVLGDSKAWAVRAAFGGDVSHDVPASLARLAPVPVEVYLDEAAAATL